MGLKPDFDLVLSPSPYINKLRTTKLKEAMEKFEKTVQKPSFWLILALFFVKLKTLVGPNMKGKYIQKTFGITDQ